MDFATLVHDYRRFDPAGWVNVYRALPVFAGLLLFSAGAALLVLGGGRLYRFIAVPLGAAVGFLWGPVLTQSFGLPAPVQTVAWVSAGLLTVLGLVFPPGVAFFLLGIPCGLFAGALAGPSEWFLGFIPAFLGGGALAAIFQRQLGALMTSVPGAWFVVMGGMAVLSSFGSFVHRLGARPGAVLFVAGVLAAAGTVYQLIVTPSPEALDRLKAERAKQKRERAEREALEKRWSNYGKHGD